LNKAIAIKKYSLIISISIYLVKIISKSIKIKKEGFKI